MHIWNQGNNEDDGIKTSHDWCKVSPSFIPIRRGVFDGQLCSDPISASSLKNSLQKQRLGKKCQVIAAHLLPNVKIFNHWLHVAIRKNPEMSSFLNASLMLWQTNTQQLHRILLKNYVERPHSKTQPANLSNKRKFNAQGCEIMKWNFRSRFRNWAVSNHNKPLRYFSVISELEFWFKLSTKFWARWRTMSVSSKLVLTRCWLYIKVPT